MQGEVIAAHGRHYLVELASTELRWCVTRGRRSDYACGDQVQLTPDGAQAGVIEGALARTSLFSRSVEHRTKLLAANPTQLAITIASEPSFSDELITRAAIAAEHQGMKTIIVLNKSDLPGTELVRERLHPLVRAGYRLISLSALTDVSALRPLLAGEHTVLMGQSGMGKSTLVNALVPDAHTLTAAISTFLDSGRHTTTASRLYRLDAQSSLIDTPGLKEFGLAHVPITGIALCFPELTDWHGTCRFANCGHRSEPDCGYRRALESGAIHPRRFELLLRIVDAERSRGRRQGG